jgi:hypothetical protein
MFRLLVPFRIVELEKTAKEELRGRCCQHIGGAIPANITQTMIFVRNLRDCSCDNGPVESHKEDGEEIGQQCQPESKSLWLV